MYYSKIPKTCSKVCLCLKYLRHTLRPPVSGGLEGDGDTYKKGDRIKDMVMWLLGGQSQLGKRCGMEVGIVWTEGDTGCCR